MNLDSIDRCYKDLDSIRKEKSDLMKVLEEKKVKFEKGDKSITQEMLRIDEMKKVELDLKENQSINELEKNIAKGVNFANEISKENDENKILEKINENVKKSTMFNLDELLTNFESLSGIYKLAYTMIFSSSIILWCVFGIILNIYGNYILDRFKLEDKYPKIALFINYRRKLSKYYIMSNFLLIISMCLINVILGISIFSI